MDPVLPPANEKIRKIEDIIDLQKANGNLSSRQVAFALPDEEEGGPTAAGARSLESGLAARIATRTHKKRTKRGRSPAASASAADADASWPSDSDVTVLRMKLCLGDVEAQLDRGRALMGDADAVHYRHDASSMVNLATLVLHSRHASKQNLHSEEFLVPLSSWEPARPPAAAAPPVDDLRPTRASKLARFLRLYFCPCCTCLYEMEKMREDRSVYLTRSRSPLGAVE